MLGRSPELKELKDDFNSSKSSLIVCFGRRRIGKSYLVNEYVKNVSQFSFEGLENQNTHTQVLAFYEALKQRFNLEHSQKKDFKNWINVFDLFTKVLKKQDKKIVIFFDEFQWMAAGRSLLTALIKKYWDNEWKKLNIQLILCGSVSSYMIQKVIKSKALYGRIDKEINLKQMSPSEAQLFFTKNKSKLEILKYLMIFGGVPKYLNDIDQKKSFEQNLASFFFDKNSSYINEYEKVFYSQFKEHTVYEKIIELLSIGPCNLETIAKKLKIRSGGGLKSYIKNLEDTQFIISYYSNPYNQKSKIKYFRIIDPFLNFYITFVKNNQKLIISHKDKNLVMNKILKGKFEIYMGHAFENFSIFNALDLAQKQGFENEVLSWGPMNIKGKNSVQIDLVYFRNDKTINVCEIKFLNKEIDPSIIPSIEKKIEVLKNIYPDFSIQKTLISLYGANKVLTASNYFEHILTLQDLIH